MLDKALKIFKIGLCLALITAVLIGSYVLYNYSVHSGSVGVASSVNDQMGWLIGMVTLFVTAFGVISVLFFAVIAALLWDSTKGHQESREILREMKQMRNQAKRTLVDQISVRNKAERLNKKTGD